LFHDYYLQRIGAALNLSVDEPVLEIGTGLGFLTEIILKKTTRLRSFEIDYRLTPYLSERYGEIIVPHDFLTLKWEDLPQEKTWKIVGNLPYNCATAMIRKILRSPSIFNQAYFTIQREVAERMVARVNQKNYGYFSLFVQHFSEPKILFNIPAQAFYPQPRVKSSVVELKLRESRQLPIEMEDVFFDWIGNLFQQRRKKIKDRIYLKPGWAAVQPLSDEDQTLQLRPENLTMHDFYRLFRKVYPRQS